MGREEGRGKGGGVNTAGVIPGGGGACVRDFRGIEHEAAYPCSKVAYLALGSVAAAAGFGPGSAQLRLQQDDKS